MRRGGHDHDEWLWGWDPTPGIVSVWADADGQATVWRRIPETGALVREDTRFRPWLLLDRIDDLQPLDGRITARELDGSGALRFLVQADDLETLTTALLRGASRRLGHQVRHVRELGKQSVL